jgi:hypothetical protein
MRGLENRFFGIRNGKRRAGKHTEGGRIIGDLEVAMEDEKPKQRPLNLAQTGAELPR